MFLPLKQGPVLVRLFPIFLEAANMKRFKRLGMLCVIGAMGLASQPLVAGTVVRQIDADTLLVTRYAGKPPHARLYLDRQRDAENFAYYLVKAGVSPLPAYAVASLGAPGKSVAKSRVRVTSDIGELTEIARLEEVGMATTDGRRWRGAPGKSVLSSK
jgi:hypothetical protein